MRAPRLRAALLLAALGCGWTVTVWLARPLAWDLRTLQDALESVLGALLLVGWAWWSAAAAVLAVEVVATAAAPRPRRHVPRAARVFVVAVCGVGAVASTAAPALADPVRVPPVATHQLTGLMLPDRPTGDVPRGARVAVLVRSGDSLWAIADELGRDWRAIYAANRGLIGPDPDLIHPGQRLAVPSTTHPEGAPR